MVGFTLPACNHPEWARSVPEEEWKTQLFKKLRGETKDAQLSKSKNQSSNDR